VSPTSRQGTAVVSVSFFATALCVGASQYGFALFIAPLEESFGWSRTEIAVSLSFAAVSGLAAPFLGRAMDRYGARPILVLSLCITGVAFGLRPLMSELWHWYALSFLQFIAFSGATMLPMGKLVAVWFARTRGRAMGIAAMGNNVGGLIVPPTVIAILAFATWREGFVALSIASFALALIAMFSVKERPSNLHQPAPVQSSPTLDKPSPPGTVLNANEGMTVSQAMRTPAFFAVVGAVTLGSFTYSAMLPHVFAHLVNSGITLERASFTLGTLAVGGIAGKLLFGFLAERLGARVAAIINLTGQATFAMALGFAVTSLSLSLLTPAFGLFMGGFGVLITLLVQDTFGLRHFGSIMGLVNASNIVSFGLGPLIAGLSYDLTGAYTAGFAITSGLFALGALVLLAVRLPGRTHATSS
jgi:sugar phosphate permease